MFRERLSALQHDRNSKNSQLQRVKTAEIAASSGSAAAARNPLGGTIGAASIALGVEVSRLENEVGELNLEICATRIELEAGEDKARDFQLRADRMGQEQRQLNCIR